MATATQPAKNISPETTFGITLNLVREKSGLSLMDLRRMCGDAINGAGKSTIARLCAGESSAEFITKVKPLLAQGLRSHLLSLGQSHDEVTAELSSLFNTEEITPMHAPKTRLHHTIYRQFGLTRDPFSDRPGRKSEVWTNAELDAVLDQISDAIADQKFIAILGDVGSGKSLMKLRVNEICADSEGRMRLLWPRRFDMPLVKANSITAFILEHFEQKIPPDGMIRCSRVEKLLADLSDQNIRVAIGFDECHQLNDQVLLELKNFHEMGSGGFINYLGIILFGQPQFRTRLLNPKFRELAERIEMIEMPRLTKYAWDYVTHRLKVAGGEATEIFEEKAIDALAQQAETPLALGNLCNLALKHAAHYREKQVTLALVTERLKVNYEPQIRAVRRSQ